VAFNGFINISSYTVVWEWAVKVAPDIGEGLSAGMLAMMANFIGFLYIIVIQSVSDEESILFCTISLMLANLFIAFWLLWKVKE
jgi:hypothetical protein